MPALHMQFSGVPLRPPGPAFQPPPEYAPFVPAFVAPPQGPPKALRPWEMARKK